MARWSPIRKNTGRISKKRLRVLSKNGNKPTQNLLSNTKENTYKQSLARCQLGPNQMPIQLNRNCQDPSRQRSR